MRRNAACFLFFFALCWMLPTRAAEPPKKLSASAIQINLVEVGNVEIPQSAFLAVLKLDE